MKIEKALWERMLSEARGASFGYYEFLRCVKSLDWNGASRWASSDARVRAAEVGLIPSVCEVLGYWDFAEIVKAFEHDRVAIENILVHMGPALAVNIFISPALKEGSPPAEVIRTYLEEDAVWTLAEKMACGWIVGNASVLTWGLEFLLGSLKWLAPRAIQSAAAAGKRGMLRALSKYVDLMGMAKLLVSVAAWHGRCNVIDWFLEKGTFFKDVLVLAAIGGKERVARYALEKGNYSSWTDLGLLREACNCAARYGHVGVLRLVMERHQGMDLGEPLEEASCGGHREIVELLLKELGPTQRGGLYSAGLCAARSGDAKMMKMLLARAKETAQPVEQYEVSEMELLQQAALSGSAEVVELILPSVRKRSWGPVLQEAINMAASRGSLGVLRVLLQREYSALRAPSNDPICMASRSGRDGAVRLLLAMEIVVWNETFGDAIVEAIRGGSDECLRLLLDALTRRSALSFHRPTLLERMDFGVFLSHAVGVGSPKSVQAILRYVNQEAVVRALVDALTSATKNRGKILGIALDSILAQGRLSTDLELMLASVAGGESAPDGASAGAIALAFKGASRNGNAAIAEALLPRVVSVSALHDGLFDAAMFGNASVAGLLLKDNRVDPSRGDSYAIRAAATNGHAGVVGLLLADKRSDASALNNTAIAMACTNGHAAVVAALLKDGAVSSSVNISVAIVLASGGGHFDVLSVLMEGREVFVSKDMVRPPINNDNSGVLKLFLDRIHRVDREGVRRRQKLMQMFKLAAKRGSIECLKLLVRAMHGLSALDALSAIRIMDLQTGNRAKMMKILNKYLL